MRYQLRYAAGRYWLLDMEQEGIPYVRPLMTNEAGACIWKMVEQGFDREQIVESLCQEYSVEREVAAADVEQFLRLLETDGV